VCITDWTGLYCIVYTIDVGDGDVPFLLAKTKAYQTETYWLGIGLGNLLRNYYSYRLCKRNGTDDIPSRI